MFTLLIKHPNRSRTIRAQTRLTMLYDTYGEEYLIFLRELNEILSLNELAELDYL